MGKKKSGRIVVGENGDPCPRCGKPTEIREHRAITEKELRRPFYYSRWFYCTNRHCRTKLIMPSRFIVWAPEPRKNRRDDIPQMLIDQLTPPKDFL